MTIKISKEGLSILDPYKAKIFKTNEEKEEFDNSLGNIYSRKKRHNILCKLKDQTYFGIINKNTNKIVAGCKLALSWADNKFLCNIYDELYGTKINLFEHVKESDIFVEINELFSLIPKIHFSVLKQKLYDFFFKNNLNYAFILAEESILRFVNQSGLVLVQRLTDKSNPIKFKGINKGYFLCKLLPNYRVDNWNKEFENIAN
jgi:hypothetical protein